MQANDGLQGRMHGQMQGRAALVTGAGADGEEIGIGRAIAITLAREGAMVACLDLDPKRAEATAAMNCADGGTAIALAGNVMSAEDCAASVSATVDRLGHLDCLLNNVGIAAAMSVEAFDQALWQRIFETNVTSAMLSRARRLAISLHRAGAASSTSRRLPAW